MRFSCAEALIPPKQKERNGAIKNNDIPKSGIPETTLRDLLSGSVRLENCKAGTILRLARAFHVSVEELLMHSGEHPADYPEHRAQSVPEDEQTAFCALLHALSQLLPDS